MQKLQGGAMMPNSENLVPNSERTPSRVKENARKGGIASGKARREKKMIQEALQKALKGKYVVGEEGKLLGGYEALAVAMIQQAVGGNVQAFKEIRDTIGEKPTDTLEIGCESMTGIKVKFVDKSNKRAKEKDPKIVGDYTPPLNYDN